ncbi:hypothetical protein P4O66_003632 [Electrophorus voltai]|uniref:Aquaporin 10b n=1 Tax=Electrophorus voltai TaxID=2609070 RepID=A0AAD8ZT75_9TELE|nr:hypothetical protein P4O66_003632 [Electrophorus voltai]
MEVRRFLVWLRQQGKVRNALLRECLGEVLGTFIFMMFGCAALAQVKTSRGSKGQYLSANMAFSVGVMCAMYCCRGISGAHMNPAVSLSCCVLGRLAWSKLLPYCLAQVIGAFLAAGLVFLMYHDAIMSYSGGVLTVYGPNETASIFATYPVEFLSLGSSFLDQAVGTGMVLLCFLPLDDQQNSPAPPDLVPPLAATVLLGVSMSMSYNCGGGINPARDFGPRLFTFMAGWGSDVFTCFFCCPLVVGAHLNPAVSLSLCFLGRFPWTRLPFYVISQVFGAFLGAATVALQYYDAIFHYMAGIFSTYPAEYLSVWGGVVDQVIGTAALLVCVLALSDCRNNPAPPGLEPILVGAVVMVIGISMGSNSGDAINPARDIRPRVFTSIASWSDEVFSDFSSLLHV